MRWRNASTQRDGTGLPAGAQHPRRRRAVSPGVAGTLNLSARLFETSRHTQPDGVNIPIIREDRFFTAPSRFLAVPVAGWRAALRIYDPRRRDDAATVRVEVFANDGRSVGETFSPSFVVESWGIRSILDLAGAFPELATLERFDVRVTPLVEGMEYWAMVSVTDNETQQVLLITAD